MEIVQGNLLDAKGERLIAQQCNCCSAIPHGLSATIAAKYPYASCYARRRGIGRRNHALPACRSKPGTIEVDTPPPPPTYTGTPSLPLHPHHSDVAHDDAPPAVVTVVHLFGQYYMGKPGAWGRPYATKGDPEVPDTPSLRIGWFRDCLGATENWMKIHHHTRIAMPYQIGCGLAGGRWSEYSRILQEWAEATGFQVVLYQLV